jgi:hypothetical protein
MTFSITLTHTHTHTHLYMHAHTPTRMSAHRTLTYVLGDWNVCKVKCTCLTIKCFEWRLGSEDGIGQLPSLFTELGLLLRILEELF